MTNACASVRPAHEGQRRHFNFAGAHAPQHLVAGHHVVQGVVERAQVGIDFFLQVAGQEPQALAGLDRGAAQHDAFDAAGLQHGHRLRHGEIGLAGAGRPEREHHFVALQGFHVGKLARAARAHGAAAGADGRQIRQRQPGILVGRAAQPDDRIDIARGDPFAALQPLPKPRQRRLGGVDSLRPRR